MLARLRTLMKDRAAKLETPADEGDALAREWELAREEATSATERAEIDAIFGRHAA